MLLNLFFFLSFGTVKETRKHSSVVLDLVEQGFLESANFLRRLFDFEAQYRATPENVADSNNWPWLCETENLLNVVVSSLRDAELARRNGKHIVLINFESKFEYIVLFC